MDARSRSTISRREVLCAGLLASLGTGAFASRTAGAASADEPSGSGGASRDPLILKPIPSTGERIPVIGLGTDSFSGSDRDAIREEIAKMHQLGGTVIDTAAAYGDSEGLIGEALADSGLHGKMFIATKLTNGGGFFYGGGVGGKASFDRSLQRLKTDKVDLLQVHN